MLWQNNFLVKRGFSERPEWVVVLLQLCNAIFIKSFSVWGFLNLVFLLVSPILLEVEYVPPLLLGENNFRTSGMKCIVLEDDWHEYSRWLRWEGLPVWKWQLGRGPSCPGEKSILRDFHLITKYWECNTDAKDKRQIITQCSLYEFRNEMWGDRALLTEWSTFVLSN